MPVLPMSAARVFFDGTFTDPRVAHPEGVAVHSDGSIWCGNEIGQLLRIPADGSRVELMAETGGFLLGIAFDLAGNCYACDLRHKAVFRYDAGSGAMERFTEPGILVPNFPVLDEANSHLYVSDSRGNGNIGPGIYRYDLATGKGGVWCDADFDFANGMCMDAEGRGLYVVQSDVQLLSYVPIEADGRAGEPRAIAENLDNVPDGVALAPDGTLYVSCYEPSRIYRLKPGGAPEIFIEDPHATTMAHPTNVALKGNRMYTANLGRWHITEIDLEGL
ncbi:gluconolaconase [Arsenicitalea aurantiaca]|uniref:Gluconolaconase n=1 Tax=Arsenicitalea aurantiaca TaxID=1783274 RepID=A0A433XES4_9HYPH|nr:SMP-30/gluconolactonase/LRE family protein [Arsenicitalea aurantiaca]RUT32504.1 gluconolaconase [Arsenicitalea aurantiaca]